MDEILGPSRKTGQFAFERVAAKRWGSIFRFLTPLTFSKKIRPVEPRAALLELGRRGMTNVLIEGGAAILGAFADLDLIDEVQVFIGSKLIGGQAAPGPLSGIGCNPLSQARRLDEVRVEVLDGDVSLSGRVRGHVW